MDGAYCTPTSVLPGEAVALHVSTASGSGAVEVEVVRDGSAPEVVWRRSGVPAARQPVPDDAPERGCRWDVTTTIETEGWHTGMHLVRVDGVATAWFVVRPAPGAAPDRPLLVLATNTWNAYNEFGGRNLYTGAVELSFERPLGLGMLAKPGGRGERVVSGGAFLQHTFDNDLSLWHGMAGWAGQERRFVAWAEREGIELDYATNADVERVPGLLDGRSLLLSVGHDEYWSWPMRDVVEGFVTEGGNVAFLSGNTCYWQVRLEGHVMVCFKHRFAEDPLHGTDQAHLTTTMWADPILGRPEAALTGVSFTRGGYARLGGAALRGSGGYEVHRPDHWLLEGTGAVRGDVIGAEPVVVGYECDGCDLALVDGLPVATGQGGTPTTFEVVATSPATPFDETTTPLPLAPGGEYELAFHARRLLGDDSPAAQDRLRAGHAVLGCWTGGGTVVTTGCTEWAYGLDDPVIGRVTRTVVERLGTLRLRGGDR